MMNERNGKVSLDDVLRAVERVTGRPPKRIPSGYKALCPVHEDRNPSLSIRAGRTQPFVLKCHAGCEYEAIMKALGLWQEQLTIFDAKVNGNGHQAGSLVRRPAIAKDGHGSASASAPTSPAPPPRKRIAAQYNYYDANGRLLFQKVRYEPKDFRIRRPLSDGSWDWNLEGVEPVLYNLPILLQYKEDLPRLFFIVEGEKDADRLAGCGLAATTNFEGAGKWREAYNALFKNLIVCIVPDNDKAGRQHAELVASNLHGIAEQVKIVPLPDLPPKGDVSNWLDAGHTWEELCAYGWATPEWEPESSESAPQALDSWEDIKEAIGPTSWAWSGWLPIGHLTMIASEPGVGKSALCLWLASRFIQGGVWPDGTPFEGQQGKVLWIETEAGQGINLERAEAWGLPLEGFVYPFAGEPLADVMLENPDHRQAIANAAAHPEVRFIVIDSFSGAHRHSENDTRVLDYLRFLAELARDTNKPLLLTHHLRKRGLGDGQEVTLERVRGSSSIVQLTRVVWALDVPNGLEREAKRLSMIKNNLGPFPKPLGMAIGADGLTFGDAPMPAAGQAGTVKDDVADLLYELLADGPVAASTVREELEATGLSWRTAGRVKRDLGIESEKKSDGWYWSLPAA